MNKVVKAKLNFWKQNLMQFSWLKKGTIFHPFLQFLQFWLAGNMWFRPRGLIKNNYIFEKKSLTIEMSQIKNCLGTSHSSNNLLAKKQRD